MGFGRWRERGRWDRGWPAYVPVAQRRARAERAADKLRKKGRDLQPVCASGNQIARTFWGRAWCENLERYSDYANRLPRGRSYLRNGLVVDLRVEAGKVAAQVSGTRLYAVEIGIRRVDGRRWRRICGDCAGGIDSLVELLAGRLSEPVMAVLTRPATGLFPEPREIELSCSCPDSAVMCKHVAAALYGVGARLDERPELLFLLRGVDQAELIGRAAAAPLTAQAPASERVLRETDLSGLFGIEVDETPSNVREVRAEQRAAAAHMAAAPAVRSRAARRAASPAESGATAAETSRQKPAQRPASPQRAAALALQGRYIGLLRKLAGAQRERIRKIARAEGLVAAVAALERLVGKRKPGRRSPSGVRKP